MLLGTQKSRPRRPCQTELVGLGCPTQTQSQETSLGLAPVRMVRVSFVILISICSRQIVGISLVDARITLRALLVGITATTLAPGLRIR